MANLFETNVMAALEEPRLHRLDRLSQVLDSAFPIPGTRFRIGLDGILGFIPGVGDIVGAALSTYLIFEAARLGVPKRILLRMIANVAVETVIGAIPIIGDIFDIAWKANVRNLALLRAYGTGTALKERSPRHIMGFFLGVIVLTIIGLVMLSILGLRLIYQFITS